MKDLVQSTTEGVKQRGDHPVTMDAALKAKWIEALRSGEYSQTTGVLHNTVDGGYCCIGVLCKVAGLPIDHIDDRVSGSPGAMIVERYAAAVELLGGHDIYQLTARNDGTSVGAGREFTRHSFSEIADYIEANL